MYAVYAAFFGAVAREVGMERALALHARSLGNRVLASGELLKQKIGERPKIEMHGSVLRASNLSIGIDCQLGIRPTRHRRYSATHSARCTVATGWAGWTRRRRRLFVSEALRPSWGRCCNWVDPRIAYRLKHYRARPDETCEEEIGDLQTW